MAKFTIEGMDDLQKSIKRLGGLPQKYVTKAAKKGNLIAKKSAKKGGWIDQTGNLRKGIIQKGEKTRTKGKKVYQVTIDPAMNDVFQKSTTTGKRRIRRGKKVSYGDGGYYYPASQEFGFVAKSRRYVPGFSFMEKSLTENKGQIEKVTIEVLEREMEKALKGWSR